MRWSVYSSFVTFSIVILLIDSALADEVEDKDIECCNCSGKCGDGSFLLYAYPGVSPNYYDCLDKCLAYVDPNNPLVECGFFTHDVALEKCYLYSNCPELDASCLTCTTGNAECDPLECDLFGKQCQGILLSEEDANGQFDCACLCDGEPECNYFTANVEFDHCYLYETCDAYFDCPACVSGEQDCWITFDEECPV